MSSRTSLVVRATAVILTAALLAACSAPSASTRPAGASPSGGPAASPPAASAPGASLPQRIEPSPSVVAVVGEVPAPILETARRTLAETIGTQAAAGAGVVVGEAVTWPDGSLGCPLPGQYYTQHEVPGYRIVLEAGGTQHDFRATAAGYVVACERGGPRAP